jgi:hypothetical protein
LACRNDLHTDEAVVPIEVQIDHAVDLLRVAAMCPNATRDFITGEDVEIRGVYSFVVL